MWITKTADTKQNGMDLKCNIPETIWQAKSVIREDACMTFYAETQWLYLGTDASEIRLRAAPLQIRSGKAVQETEHQTTAYSDPLPFAGKSLSIAKENIATLKDKH